MEIVLYRCHFVDFGRDGSDNSAILRNNVLIGTVKCLQSAFIRRKHLMGRQGNAGNYMVIKLLLQLTL
jgi:hypothetical protein